MRTTWNRVLVAGTLAVGGLPALFEKPAAAQGYTGGMTAPSPSASPYTSPAANTAPSPYAPVASPYGSSASGLATMPAAPAAPYGAGGNMAGGAMAPGAGAYYAPAANPGAANTAATAPYGAYGPKASPSPYAPATLPSPYMPAASAPASPYAPAPAASPYGSAASPYGSATSPYGANAALAGGRAVAPASATNYGSGVPAVGGGVLPGRNGVSLGAVNPNDPSGMRASYADPTGYANPAASAPGGGAAAGALESAARGSAFAPDTKPYAPPPKPSRMRRFYNWLTGDDKANNRPVHTYMDPSTGRTDLPLSKPWLKQVW